MRVVEAGAVGRSWGNARLRAQDLAVAVTPTRVLPGLDPLEMARACLLAESGNAYEGASGVPEMTDNVGGPCLPRARY